MTYRVVVVGAGRMGQAVARLLASDARFSVVLADPVEQALAAASIDGVERVGVSGTDKPSLARVLSGASAVICAANASVVPEVAHVARETGCHYIDLCESPDAAAAVARIAQGASTGFAPGCGLAPGYISALLADVLAESGPDTEVSVFVGVLPALHTNRLGYGNIWGLDGLISEYTAPCLALRDGQVTRLAPLSELETVQISGETFEAFTTAGSLDELVTANAGRIKSLVFKTLRYPGHLDHMLFLMDDLGLRHRLYQLRSLLLNGLPRIENDVMILRVVTRDGSAAPITRHQQTIKACPTDGGWQSAISRSTAAHVAAVTDLLCSGLAPHAGLLQHDSLTQMRLQASPFMSLLTGAAKA